MLASISTVNVWQLLKRNPGEGLLVDDETLGRIGRDRPLHDVNGAIALSTSFFEANQAHDFRKVSPSFKRGEK